MRRARGKRLLLGLAGLSMGLLVLWLGRVLVLPLAVAGLLCYLLLPLVRRLEGWGLKSCWAILLAYGALFGGTALAACWGLPRLWRDLAAIGQLMPETVAEGVELWERCTSLLPEALGLWVGELLPGAWAGVGERLLGSLGENVTAWLGRSLRLLPSFFGNLSMLIFAPVFAFYLLRDREALSEWAWRRLPWYWRRRLWPLFSELNGLFRSFVRGYLLVAACVGLLFYLLLWLFGVKYSFTLGLIMTVAELIPYLGPLLAFVPSVLLTLAGGGQGALIKMLLIWLCVQQMENLVISPRIMGGAVRLHPAYVIGAVLVGGFWFGVTGMIAAVPLAAALKPTAIFLANWWREGREVSVERWHEHL